MARPNKQGLDYFPLNTDISKDDKIALIEAKHGLIGYGVIIKLYEKIYYDKGYYYEWNEDTQLLFSKQVGLEVEKVTEIINDAIKRDLFDEELFKKYKILTSKRIQKTFLEATKRRREIPMIQKYLLNGVNGYINKVNTNIILINDNINSQTETETETEIEIETETTSTQINEIINYLNEKANTNYKTTTKKTRDLIKARFNEGFTMDDFKTVIDKKVKLWTDTEFERFIRPETLFGTKFESYLNEKIVKKGKGNARDKGYTEREYTKDEWREIEQAFCSKK